MKTKNSSFICFKMASKIPNIFYQLQLTKRKKLVILLILVMHLFDAFSQTDPVKLPVPNNIIPASPNVASLGTYGERNVSLYTGQVDIGIPLYTIQAKKITVPISINYQPSGVKVESIASWVGSQWSLNAGGAISRQLMGMPDETDIGYSKNASRQQIASFIAGGMPDGVATDYLNRLSTGQEDSEPDIFFYSQPQESGKFFYGYDGQIHEAPVRKNTIEKLTINGRTGWKITNVSGIEYNYLDREEASIVSLTSLGSQTSFGTTPKSKLTFDSGWYLSKIVDKNSGETIYFDYETFWYTQRSIGSTSKYIAFDDNCTSPGSGEGYTITNMAALRLKKIRFPNGTIDFFTGAEREDLPGDRVLDKIVVSNLKGEVVRSFNFSYRYTAATSPLGTEYGKRLFLDKVAEGDGTLGSYTFSYNPIDLPNRLSYNQDHWGYFNNSDNTTLVASNYYFNATSGSYVGVSGANKDIDTAYCQAGVLQRISYPTGGYTNFTYENNTVHELPPDFDLKVEDREFVLNLNGNNSQNTTYFEKSFDVADEFANTQVVLAKLTGSFGCQSSGFGSGSSFFCPQVRLMGPNGFNMQINESSFGKSLNLKKGKYTIVADYEMVPDPQTKIQAFSFVLTWPGSYRSNASAVHNIKVGGLRIKQINNYEQNGKLASSKRYAYCNFGNPNLSSGMIMNVPYYQFNLSTVNSTSGWPCKWICLTATSNTGLGTTNGSIVGYAAVTEYFDQDGVQGKKEYVYVTNANSPSNRLPFAPVDNRDFFKGMLIKEKFYAFKNQGYLLQKELNHHYQMSVLSGSTYGLGLKVALNHIQPVSTLSHYTWDTYNVSPGWTYLDSTETKINLEGQTVTEKLAFTQHPINFMTNRIELIGSNGLVKTKVTKYPADYIDGSYGSNLLSNKQLFDVALEQSEYQGNKLIAKESYQYEDFLNSAQLSKISKLSTVSQQMKEQINFTSYDKFGNPLCLSKFRGPSTCYIWSYMGQYPIAEIKNADWGTVEQLLGGSSVIDAFNNSNPSDQGVKSFVATLRTALPKAEITTYTYKPLVGMTSQTDAKGMTIYYEYDLYGRLQYVKDHNGNIVKTYSYHFKP